MLGTLGAGVPIGVPKALHNEIKDDNNEEKSPKNLSPSITGSIALLSPSKISLDCITVFGESTLTLLEAFRLIVSFELNIIESNFEFKINLPEFSIICSSLYRGADVGGVEYDL